MINLWRNRNDQRSVAASLNTEEYFANRAALMRLAHQGRAVAKWEMGHAQPDIDKNIAQRLLPISIGRLVRPEEGCALGTGSDKPLRVMALQISSCALRRRHMLKMGGMKNPEGRVAICTILR